MKKLIFILLMFPMLAIGQHHMMSILSSQKKPIYEGVMTVGEYSWEYNSITYFFRGYSIYEPPTGEMNPAQPKIVGFPEALQIGLTYYEYESDWYYRLSVANYSGGQQKACNSIEIDGVEYTGFGASGEISIDENPFPGNGETCTIKLK